MDKLIVLAIRPHLAYKIKKITSFSKQYRATTIFSPREYSDAWELHVDNKSSPGKLAASIYTLTAAGLK
ncbi:hypothetical protein [Undibacterium hunanense]|uniref:hypothetical protein n=1 Tax=Undibacterium hunanense TaxID=2762292 RepID=UPI00164CA8F4|nr:hypothetical protein [Undibacterium hunanense]